MKSTFIVIPLLNSGPYEQLRYALRSITTHMPIDRCILVGGKPNWYNGEHIQHEDYGLLRKEENIRDKVIAGAPDCSFLFANDDHILLAPITTTWNKGPLSSTLVGRNPNGTYGRLLHNTIQRYGDVPNVDCHCPMMMTGEGVKRTALFDWPQFGIGFKTAYAQENWLESVYIPDCKTDKLPEDRQWFSMTDTFDVRQLVDLFPNPSKFEI